MHPVSRTGKFGHCCPLISLSQIMNSFPDSMTEKMTPDLRMLLVLQKVLSCIGL
jgi:hypothetical protein